jgi:non-canonical purine NTP pyrophosphatase (RdgB/HAM1 family)
MQDFVFVTGNKHKLEYLQKWLGHPVKHQDVDLEELQSLDLEAVVRHKAEGAYAIVKKPVLVEDVALTFHALGRLPGTLVKWFLQEVQSEGLCRMLEGFSDRTATAQLMYCLYDGKDFHLFDGQVPGTVPDSPRSSEGGAWTNTLSWNSVFAPNGSSKTYAEMADNEFKRFSHRAVAISKLKEYLDAL